MKREFQTKTEHAQLMSGGGYHVRNDDPEIEQIYPLAEWIKSSQRFGGKVYRRIIIVVQDWEEVSIVARGKRDEKEKKERARKVARIVKEEVKPAKDVTPCPICEGRGKPGRGCPLCGTVS